MASGYQEITSDKGGGVGPDVGIRALPLLTTKLYRPPVTPDLEQRTRLIERLQRTRQRPLTLISAPAGYGKTMLASMWLESCGCPSAWVSLDETDNDLQLFTSYLLAALYTIFPTLELKTRSLLEAPVLPAAPVLARYLLNDLDQPKEPFILALDDVHLIREQAIVDLLSELLRHPPPSLHLVLIGRHDPDLPIPSLRARSQITEVRALDLRFTPQETAGLLRGMLHREIDDAVAEEWTEKTEGWVTALRLAGLSLRHRDLVDNLQVDIHGDSRYLKDFLLAEVLSQMPVAKQAWLLKTAILDRFCAPLCEAVCQVDADCASTGMDGEEFIDWLGRENLFLIPLDEQHKWFRFHHLFQQHLQDMLQAQLDADEVIVLRLAASRWFAEKGLVEEALRYALTAGDTDFAVDLVIRRRYELMNTEQWHHLRLWLSMLPEDVVSENPLLMTTRAYLGVHRGDDLEMYTSKQRAERLLTTLSHEASEYPIVQGEVGALQAVFDIVAGPAAHTIEGAQRCLQQLPLQAYYIRSLAVGAIAVGMQMLGDLKPSVVVINEALADRSWPAGIRAKVRFYQSIAYFQEGYLAGVLASSRECLRMSEHLQLPETLSFARCFLSTSHYLRNQFAEVRPYSLATWEDRAVSAPSYLANAVFVLALVHNAQGRMAEAVQVIDQLSAHLRDAKDLFVLAITDAFRIELALRQGKLAQARQLSIGIDFDMRPPLWFFYVPQLTPIKLLLAEGTRKALEEARARLEALDEAMRKSNRNNVRIDVLALLALVCDALREEPAALEKLCAALALGQAGGFIRTFVDLGAPMATLLLRLKERDVESPRIDYIDQIMAAFPGEAHETKKPEPAPTRPDHQPPTLPLMEPLTRRERQVLKLLATDLSQQEIAAQLHISTGTVYSHTKNIYSKLDVHKRAEAVQRARELDLI